MIEQFQGEDGTARVVECLRQLALTGGSQNIAAALAQRASLLEFEPGQLILRQGGSDDDLYFLLSGSVSVQINGRHTAVRSSVTYIGELAILDPDLPRLAAARAIDTVVCAKLAEPDFSAIAKQYPELWRALAVQALDRLSEHGAAADRQGFAVLTTDSNTGRLVGGTTVPARPVARARAHGPDSRSVLSYWLDAGPARWFKKDAAFDAEFGRRFAELHAAAARGELDAWAADAEGALALLILLDQYPRNAFRDTPRTFACDHHARLIASRAVDAGFDQQVDSSLQVFFYLPFMHSEDLVDQNRCVSLCSALDDGSLRYAQMHRDIIARFGRFPHRNALLGRTSSAQELAFLQAGGFSG